MVKNLGFLVGANGARTRPSENTKTIGKKMIEVPVQKNFLRKKVVKRAVLKHEQPNYQKQQKN